MGIESFERHSDTSGGEEEITDARINQPEEFERVKNISEKAQDDVCFCCDAVDEESDMVTHHLCYSPEVTITVCEDCHGDIHHSDKYPELKPINRKDWDLRPVIPISLEIRMEREAEGYGLELYELGGYNSKGEFIRDAVREKLDRHEEEYL